MKLQPGKVQDWTYDENIVAHFRESSLKGNACPCGVELKVREGILILDTKLLPLQEVLFTYKYGQEAAALGLVQKLLEGPLDFVLAEPQLKNRVEQLLGRWGTSPELNVPLRQLAELYLPWQVFGISQGWAQLLGDARDKLLVRQLRVKLRRLRSCFIFFKEVLPEAFVLKWQQSLRNGANVLSKMRELDVALLTCERMQRQNPDAGEDPLEEVFKQLREEATQEMLAQERINQHTLAGARFLVSLRAELRLKAKKLRGDKYFGPRLETWMRTMQGLTKKYPDFSNMEDLHKVRIKVKRFRYATQTMNVLAMDAAVVRRLKRLQDMLGFLHDDYINAAWAKLVLQQHAEDQALKLRAAEFLGWERAKAEASLSLVPELWADFLQELDSWQKK